MKDKTTIRKKLIIEGIISLLIAISPLMFYFYKYLPIDSQSWSFLGIEFTSNGFNDISDAFYYYFNKIVPLLLLVIWFITSKNWWYHAILIPISMYSFQLFTVLNYSSSKIDENEILYVVAVTMVVVPVVYFIRLKLVDKHVHGIDLDAMDTELQILKEKEELRKEREKLEQRQKTLSKKM
ncbi:MAG: hypothetical protein DSY83_17170 [Flavobacteriia bacterium]|uniref:Uncharacterized protein n=1 Tax=Flagellimonas hadalis TaxID=2597517 RepID=A0A5N5IV60_9FLAO|nr:hypothetical protein FOT42_001625 [Allomuricauda hadalis]RUA10955.1 MAG: hypothetical protein DSY83_17170 [Flavobacteriia bacterium]